MIKRLLKSAVAALVAICGVHTASAAVGVVKVKTSAPAGTELRIMAEPYEFEVAGADAGTFFGTYLSKGPDTEITISCEGLSNVEVYGCQLTEFTVVGAPDLSIVRCYNNQIESLDLSGSPELAVLDCHNNALTSLDVSANTKLEKLNANDNKLTSLTLGALPKLEELKCGGNRLEALSVGQCPALTSVDVHNCGTSNLNFNRNIRLSRIDAYGNNIKGDRMATFIADLPEISGSGLLYIVDTRDAAESNVCLMENVAAAYVKNWLTMDWQGGENNGAVYMGADYQPEVGENTITMVTSRAVGETIKLNIESKAVTVSGVAETSGFTGSLKTFTLTSQTVVIKGDVTKLECSGNDLTSLSFAGEILLTDLDCRNNKLVSLNVENASKLARLYCQTNQLKSVDVAGCDALLRMDVYQNAIKGGAAKRMMNALRKGEKDEPLLMVIDTKAAAGLENNVITTTDVAIATGKNWEVKDWSNGDRYQTGVKYEGSEPVGPELPDEYFTITQTPADHLMFSVKFADGAYADATTPPTVEGAEISGWNGEALTLKMTEGVPAVVYGDAVSLQPMFSNVSAIDVSNLPNLTELYIGLNDLTELDVTNNAKLTTLSCEGNLLTAMDLSGCPDLTYLNCYGNAIKGAAMTALVNSLPQRTEANYGRFVVVDPTYTQSANVCLKSDVAIARSKYWAAFTVNHEGSSPMLEQYEGEDPAGIGIVSADGADLRYDAAAGVITVSQPTVIEVYAVSGALAARADGVTELDVTSLPAGVYVLRAAGKVLKIVK